MVMLATKRIPVMLAAVMTLAAYVFHDLFSLGWSMWVAGAFALAVAVILGLLLDTFERFVLERHENVQSWLSIAFGLGLFTIAQSVVVLIWKQAGRTFLMERRVLDVLEARITDVHVITISGAVLALFAVTLLLNSTQIGLQLRALRSNPPLCEIMGMNILRTRAIGITSGVLLAGMGVFFFVLDVGLTPSSGFNLFLAGLTAAIVGGVGSVSGAIAGAIFIALVRNLTAYHMGVGWMETTTYAVLILVLIVRPLGFSGRRLKKIEI